MLLLKINFIFGLDYLYLKMLLKIAINNKIKTAVHDVKMINKKLKKYKLY